MSQRSGALYAYMALLSLAPCHDALHFLLTLLFHGDGLFEFLQ